MKAATTAEPDLWHALLRRWQARLASAEARPGEEGGRLPPPSPGTAPAPGAGCCR